MIKVVQELFSIPRWIFHYEFPQEFNSLRSSYLDFVMETDAMGEDMLEFMLAVERHDLDEVSDLFSDPARGTQQTGDIANDTLARDRAFVAGVGDQQQTSGALASPSTNLSTQLRGKQTGCASRASPAHQERD
jgi:hypothetical protein